MDHDALTCGADWEGLKLAKSMKAE